jgi:hypothetical protein
VTPPATPGANDEARRAWDALSLAERRQLLAWREHRRRGRQDLRALGAMFLGGSFFAWLAMHEQAMPDAVVAALACAVMLGLGYVTGRARGHFQGRHGFPLWADPNASRSERVYEGIMDHRLAEYESLAAQVGEVLPPWTES